MKKLFLIVCLFAVALSAQAMSPKAEAFLRQAGIDLQAPEVRRAIKDGVISTTFGGDPEETSLESLALAGRTHGVKTFVETREFIRRLKKDFAHTSFPTENYDPRYLTPDERKLAAKKVASEYK
jgi:hypothetical protein